MAKHKDIALFDLNYGESASFPKLILAGCNQADKAFAIYLASGCICTKMTAGDAETESTYKLLTARK